MPNYVDSSQSLVFRDTSADKLRPILVEVSRGYAIVWNEDIDISEYELWIHGTPVPTPHDYGAIPS
jgi:hypothetical protein